MQQLVLILLTASNSYGRLEKPRNSMFSLYGETVSPFDTSKINNPISCCLAEMAFIAILNFSLQCCLNHEEKENCLVE